VSAPNRDLDQQQRFAQLYESTYPDVLRFVRRRARLEAAEDVTHETFLTAWRRFEVVPVARDEARAWLFGTARNHLLSDARAHSRREALTVQIGFALDASPGQADDASFRVDLVRSWKLLEARQQEVLALAIWEGLPSDLAGRVLGISAAAYRLRLHRARTALRRLLDPLPVTNTASSPVTENNA
jgi:RNA polymerase sigma-70 factor (ECF subfamily)